jgi:iron(III) transport system permease protein
MPEKKYSTLSLKWDEMQKILRDPILLATIILVGLSLIIFIVWPLYEVLFQSFINDQSGS